MKTKKRKRRVVCPEVTLEEERTVQRLITAIARGLKDKGLHSYAELRQALLRAHYDVETEQLKAKQNGRGVIGTVLCKQPLTKENAQWLASR